METSLYIPLMQVSLTILGHYALRGYDSTRNSHLRFSIKKGVLKKFR